MFGLKIGNPFVILSPPAVYITVNIRRLRFRTFSGWNWFGVDGRLKTKNIYGEGWVVI